MSRYLTPLLLLTVGCLSAAEPATNTIETRMREALKKTMLQLRDSETARATAQAAQIEAETKNKELEDKVKALESNVAKLIKESAFEKEANDKSIADLKSKVALKETEAAQVAEALEKWKASHAKLTDFAKKSDAQRAALASKVVLLDRKVADQQDKNAAMYKIGTEILTRYEKFGLGTALTAREPFIGTTRVKLQNLFQDYSDKLADQKIRPLDDKKNAVPDQAAKPVEPEKAKTADAKPASGR